MRYGSAAGSEGEKSPLSQFSGTWRLVYSSAFASGSLGGFRPGLQAALVPVTIGQVHVPARHAMIMWIWNMVHVFPIAILLSKVEEDTAISAHHGT